MKTDPNKDILAFRKALGQFSTGVVVITARDPQNAPIAVTVNSFTSVSLKPPLVLWSIDSASRRHDSFVQASRFAVHVLSNTQLDAAARFSKDAYDFLHVDWHDSPYNVPLIERAIACFECRPHTLYTAGDHTIIVGKVEACQTRDGKPLIFTQGQYGAFSPQ